MGKRSRLNKLPKVKPGIEFTSLAKSVGLPAARHKTSFGHVKREVALKLAEVHGRSFTSVDEFLLTFMPARTRRIERGARVRSLHNYNEPSFDPSSDIFLAVLDEQIDPVIIKPVSGYKKRTKIPSPSSPVHKDYTGQEFFKSNAWRQLRYLAIKVYGRKCMCCGNTDQIHVDHIKPRSRYPSIELDIRNLQILCEECNVGKGTWDMKDWRTDIQRLQADIVHSKKGRL